MSFFINILILKFWIKWIFLIITACTILSTSFFSLKCIVIKAYLSIWCLIKLKSRTIIEIVIVRIEVSLNCLWKKNSSTKVILASISTQDDFDVAIFEKLTSMMQCCLFRKLYSMFKSWFEFILKCTKDELSYIILMWTSMKIMLTKFLSALIFLQSSKFFERKCLCNKLFESNIV